MLWLVSNAITRLRFQYLHVRQALDCEVDILELLLPHAGLTTALAEQSRDLRALIQRIDQLHTTGRGQ